MVGALIAAVVLAVGVAFRSEPIDPAADPGGDRRRAGAGAGELDQLVPAASRDELGDLAERVQRDGPDAARVSPGRTARLLRAQKTAQATIDSFPDPVVVVDPLGSVEQANRARPPAAGREPGRRARRFPGIRPQPLNR